MESRIYTILFKDSQTGPRSMRLTPNGTLTSRKIFAAMISGKERAEQIAAEIREDFPEATVTVKPF